MFQVVSSAVIWGTNFEFDLSLSDQFIIEAKMQCPILLTDWYMDRCLKCSANPFQGDEFQVIDIPMLKSILPWSTACGEWKLYIFCAHISAIQWVACKVPIS